MKINVQQVDNLGRAYAIITLDDGSSFGQNITGLPVDDAVAFEAALIDVAVATVERQGPTVKPRDPGISSKIGVDIPFTARDPKQPKEKKVK